MLPDSLAHICGTRVRWVDIHKLWIRKITVINTGPGDAHICVSKLGLIDSGKGLLPVRCQAIIRNNHDFLSSRFLATNTFQWTWDLNTNVFHAVYIHAGKVLWVFVPGKLLAGLKNPVVSVVNLNCDIFIMFKASTGWGFDFFLVKTHSGSKAYGFPQTRHGYVSTHIRCGTKDLSIAKRQSATVEVWELIRNFNPHFIGNMITYPCWDRSNPCSPTV